MKKNYKGNEFSLRVKSLGSLGELIAIKALVDNDFVRIQNLNDKKKNFPFGDLMAEKDGKRYLVSVKSRNKNQRNGSLNNRYKLGDKCYENAKAVCEKYEAEPYWMAVQFFDNRYSVYLGSLAQLGGRKSIPMNDQDLSKYKCLVDNKEHGIDFEPYLNICKED